MVIAAGAGPRRRVSGPAQANSTIKAQLGRPAAGVRRWACGRMWHPGSEGMTGPRGPRHAMSNPFFGGRPGAVGGCPVASGACHGHGGCPGCGWRAVVPWVWPHGV